MNNRVFCYFSKIVIFGAMKSRNARFWCFCFWFFSSSNKTQTHAHFYFSRPHFCFSHHQCIRDRILLNSLSRSRCRWLLAVIGTLLLVLCLLDFMRDTLDILFFVFPRFSFFFLFFSPFFGFLFWSIFSCISPFFLLYKSHGVDVSGISVFYYLHSLLWFGVLFFLLVILNVVFLFSHYSILKKVKKKLFLFLLYSCHSSVRSMVCRIASVFL